MLILKIEFDLLHKIWLSIIRCGCVFYYCDCFVVALRSSSEFCHLNVDESLMLVDDEDVEGRRKLPSVEDICMKDTKTLNTNVLAAEFLEGDELMSVATDSSKFHKQDNSVDEPQGRVRQQSAGDVNDELVAMMEKNQCDVGLTFYCSTN